MMGACAYPAQSVVRSSHRTWVPFNLFLTICICQSKKKSFHRQNMHGAASRDDSRLQNSRLFFSISVSSVAQEPHTLSRVSLSVLLFMEGKRDKEPSSLQIKVHLFEKSFFSFLLDWFFQSTVRHWQKKKTNIGERSEPSSGPWRWKGGAPLSSSLVHHFAHRFVLLRCFSPFFAFFPHRTAWCQVITGLSSYVCAAADSVRFFFL